MYVTNPLRLIRSTSGKLESLMNAWLTANARTRAPTHAINAQREGEPLQRTVWLVLIAGPSTVRDCVADQPATEERDREQPQGQLERLGQEAVGQGHGRCGEDAEHDCTRRRTADHTR